MAVLLDDCRNTLLCLFDQKDSRTIGYLRELNEDLGVIEKTWKPAGWFRAIMRASFARLRESVRKREREVDQSTGPISEQQPGDQTSQPLFSSYGIDEPFFNFFDSTRMHFPDFENGFMWDLNNGILPTL